MTQRFLPSLNNNQTKIIDKSFVFDSSDNYIRLCLLSHGWLELPKQSSTWQLKWTWRSNFKDHSGLQAKQMINHFKQSCGLTTKMGLTLLLKKNLLISDGGGDYSDFYPRSYNLNSEKSQFVRDFIHTGILNLLKKIIASLQIYYVAQAQQLKKLKTIQKITNSSTYLKWLLAFSTHWQTSSKEQQSSIQLNGKVLLNLLFYLENLFEIDSHYSLEEPILKQLADYGKQDPPFREKNKKLRVFPTLHCLLLLTHYYEKCKSEIKTFEQDGFTNIWMIKSNYSSRGRNIVLVDDFNEVRAHDNGMKIVQKYIQNIWILHDLDKEKSWKYPFLTKILNKKFDIRFWVLVKSFSPLFVYIYEQGYLRISSGEYRLDSLSEQFQSSHLTNYSINWKSKNGFHEESYVLLTDFLAYLSAECKFNITNFWKKIHQIILYTLRSTEICAEKQSFELFGFDILLDSKLNPWLIECNMSPSCAQRGELKEIAKQMGSGLLNIMGLIKSQNYKWKLLINQGNTQYKHSQQKRKWVECNAHYQRQLNVIGEKIGCKQYLESEKYRMVIEKLYFLQTFMKRRYKQNRKTKESKMVVGPYLQFFMILAKIFKKNKFYWFVKLRKRSLKYHSH